MVVKNLNGDTTVLAELLTLLTDEQVWNALTDEQQELFPEPMAEAKRLAETEMRDHTGSEKPIFWSGEKFPHNHLYCHRGVHCEWAEHQDFVDVFPYPIEN